MKLAIIGSSPIALEAALRFHSHGAALTWFNADEAGLLKALEVDFKECTSPLGLNILSGLGHSTNLLNWEDNYYIPLVQLLKHHHKVRPHHVVAITKRYLGESELPEGHSRFHDLFRVIFQVNPEEFIHEQKETNPETYQRLSEEFITSLQTNLEMYEDFDLVLNFSDASLSRSIAITGKALGESKVSPQAVAYGLEAIHMAAKIDRESELRELAIIGSGPIAAQALMKLSDWLTDQRNRLFLVTQEANPFKHFLSHAKAEIKEQLLYILNSMDEECERDREQFHQKLRLWQELDSFVQAKIPRPAEPIPRLVFFSGHNATAIDQLIDKRKIFLTLEKPEFRQGLKHSENNLLDLKTIGVDLVLSLNDPKIKNISSHLQINEVGYFAYSPTCPMWVDAWNRDCELIKGIEDEVFKLFSPLGPH